MKIEKKAEAKWLQFESLLNFPDLFHVTLLRSTLNLEDHLSTISPYPPPIIVPKQVHGKEVIKISSFEPSPIADGLLTTRSRLGLSVRHADCQGALFWDPFKKVLALAHAGWRGQKQNIYKETIMKMKKEGSRPENIFVCIGPSLSPESFEFKSFREDLPEDFWNFQIKPNYFDFWGIAEWQLQKAGILKQHLELAKLCTLQEKELCYSSRGGDKMERHHTIAWIGALSHRKFSEETLKIFE